MVKIYNADEKLFLNNGIESIKPLRAIVHLEDNGDYYLELTAKLSDGKNLQVGNILRVKIKDSEQGFRIINKVISKDKINIKANHLFFDACYYTIADTFIVNKTLNDAMDQLLINCDAKTPFITKSDITDINNARIVRRNLQEAINFLIERWGGHLIRDNYNITVLEKIGQDKHHTIKYGKNILEIEAEENWDNVCTKILPVGKDGLTLEEKYITSDTQYNTPYTRVVKFEQNEIEEKDFQKDDKLNEEAYKEALIKDLRDQAEQYLAENNVPIVTYRTKAYILENVELGDEIEVIHEDANINIITNVIGITYDAIANRAIEIEFGNFRDKLKNLVKRITAETDKKTTEKIEKQTGYLKDELNTAKAKIFEKIGDGHVIVEPDKIMIVDTLPAEDAKNVMLWSGGGLYFSQNGIDGDFTSAWSLDGTLDMQNIHVINLTASMIRGGTLKLGSVKNEIGKLEVYDNSENLIGTLNEEGFCIYGTDQAKLVIKPNRFYAYDENGKELFSVVNGVMNIQKTHIKEELTLSGKIRWIGVENEKNTGVGIVTLV